MGYLQAELAANPSVSFDLSGLQDDDEELAATGIPNVAKVVSAVPLFSKEQPAVEGREECEAVAAAKAERMESNEAVEKDSTGSETFLVKMDITVPFAFKEETSTKDQAERSAGSLDDGTVGSKGVKHFVVKMNTSTFLAEADDEASTEFLTPNGDTSSGGVFFDVPFHSTDDEEKEGELSKVKKGKISNLSEDEGGVNSNVQAKAMSESKHVVEMVKLNGYTFNIPVSPMASSPNGHHFIDGATATRLFEEQATPKFLLFGLDVILALKFIANVLVVAILTFVINFIFAWRGF